MLGYTNVPRLGGGLSGTIRIIGMLDPFEKDDEDARGAIGGDFIGSAFDAMDEGYVGLRRDDIIELVIEENGTGGG